jgi:signal transduction histidine kinase
MSMQDITKNKIFEEQAKLASMGEMIGNIAHQWRQPLSVITTLASGAQIKQEFGTLKPEFLTESMDNIISQANYLSQTIDDFRSFINNDNEKQEISLKMVCEKTFNILHSALTHNNITLIESLQDDAVINGYENELMQALINIINNSRDAIKENVDNDDDKIIFVSTKSVDGGFEISVKDTGGGIPRNIIPRIFEPYFTTKHQSIGTGIGLSMTYKIVTQRHNASIVAENIDFTYNEKTYRGALFTIKFKI